MWKEHRDQGRGNQKRTSKSYDHDEGGSYKSEKLQCWSQPTKLTSSQASLIPSPRTPANQVKSPSIPNQLFPTGKNKLRSQIQNPVTYKLNFLVKVKQQRRNSTPSWIHCVSSKYFSRKWKKVQGRPWINEKN